MFGDNQIHTSRLVSSKKTVLNETNALRPALQHGLLIARRRTVMCASTHMHLPKVRPHPRIVFNAYSCTSLLLRYAVVPPTAPPHTTVTPTTIHGPFIRVERDSCGCNLAWCITLGDSMDLEDVFFYGRVNVRSLYTYT